MRLYLLPVSTRRTLLYCQRFNVSNKSEKQTWSDWLQARAAKTWADWEKKDKGWQKSVVSYGNYALRRIPYEEWGLKSVPPLSERRKIQELNGTDKVEVVFPKSLIPMDRVPGVLKTLATEREGLHRRKLMWCLIGMPISAPIALLPVVPNIPFFYLVYRAWSHWRAISGGKHIQFLLENKLLSLKPSPIVDEVYADQKHTLLSTPEPTTGSPGADQFKTPKPSPVTGHQHPEDEAMLLSQSNGKKMTQALELPQLEVELERAIWQVETAIKKQSDESAKGRPAKSSGTEASTPESTESRDEKQTR